MLYINPKILAAAREATTAVELHELVKNVTRLEHTIIPPT